MPLPPMLYAVPRLDAAVALLVVIMLLSLSLSLSFYVVNDQLAGCNHCHHHDDNTGWWSCAAGNAGRSLFDWLHLLAYWALILWPSLSLNVVAVPAGEQRC
jgi:hypothetical protein